MNHVLVPCNWIEFIFHKGSAYNQVPFTKSGLAKESKEGRQTVFFTPLDPCGSDAHEEEGPSEDYSRPRRVHDHSRWRNDQNRAQDLRLQFGQTISNAATMRKFCLLCETIDDQRRSTRRLHDVDDLCK